MIENLSQKKLPENCFVFKHSTRCPISGAAAAEVESYPWPETLYWINVIEQRELSNWVQEVYGIAHQSPQLLRIKNGKAAGVLSHHSIERSQIAKLAATPLS